MTKYVLILFLFTNYIFAQEELKERDWIIKANVTQIVDVFSFPTLQFSVERRLNSCLIINAEIGYQLYDHTATDTIFLEAKGFKLNFETRVYLPKLLEKRVVSKTNEFFVGLQFFYRQNQNTNSITYTQINTNSSYIEYIDNFTTKKIAKGINITIGDQVSLKKLILEPYILLGFMYRKITNTELQYDADIDTIDGAHLSPFFQRLDLEKSSGSVFNFGIGFRIGYRL